MIAHMLSVSRRHKHTDARVTARILSLKPLPPTTSTDKEVDKKGGGGTGKVRLCHSFSHSHGDLDEADGTKLVSLFLSPSSFFTSVPASCLLSYSPVFRSVHSDLLSFLLYFEDFQ